AFAMELPWEKLDVTTFSWQKVMGGEAGFGILIISPRTVKRLETWRPPWPIPKIFQLAYGRELIEGIFEGSTINTPSMLCVEDFLFALNWAQSIGGLNALIARSNANATVIDEFVSQHDWLEHLPTDPETRSNTGVCLRFKHPKLTDETILDFTGRLVSRLEKEKVAYDIKSYRGVPPGLRIWCGATVETKDIELLMPWIEWAFNEEIVKQ
ncbi:MAG: phosphoserine aminotransferase, partial [Rhodobacteraceae bacterium]|nr:phosphoserine aminotransferase [Paracoccaceae bacterium]